MKTPHNPDNLTPEQIGEGYELIALGDSVVNTEFRLNGNWRAQTLEEGILGDGRAYPMCLAHRRKLPVSTTGTKHDIDPKAIHGDKKPQLHMIPPAASEAMARALELGARKYGERNWIESQVEYTTYHSAMRRHLDAIMDGEDLDPESTIHHLGHVMASAAIVLDAMRHGTLIDNRVLPSGKKL